MARRERINLPPLSIFGPFSLVILPQRKRKRRLEAPTRVSRILFFYFHLGIDRKSGRRSLLPSYAWQGAQAETSRLSQIIILAHNPLPLILLFAAKQEIHYQDQHEYHCSASQHERQAFQYGPEAEPGRVRNRVLVFFEEASWRIMILPLINTGCSISNSWRAGISKPPKT